MANRLINESSPYLLQHAQNPVDWYPWGPEAFQIAKESDKPVLLSVGYSACHWCHVMEEESFEDPDIALLMNERFVSIKVDREERPDVDSVYMAAVQAMTGQGGWPLTVFLTPGAQPFFGGTYYPSEPRGGMPAFPQILEAISDAYTNRRDDIMETGTHVIEHIRSNSRPSVSDETFKSQNLVQAYENLEQQFDWKLGGFGSPIKFPQPFVHEFLLRYNSFDPDSRALEMVENSLKSMASGGIYDHVGGGFHRYSTTRDWLIPHFEKMLYDNALLARLYFHTFQVTGDEFYKYIGLDILEYIGRDMTSSAGLFYSASDADSEGIEGAYFVWSMDELSSIVELDKANPLLDFFDITERGNFEGNNILRYSPDSGKHPFLQDQTGQLTAIRERLLERRYKRVPPLRDEKVIFSWNALMCHAFLDGNAATGDPDLLDKAIINIKTLLELSKEYKGIFRSWKDGKFSGYGFLDDYSNFINALIRAHALTSDPEYLSEALRLADLMILEFWDSADEVFYDTPNNGETLIYRPNDYYDNAVPSGASAACVALRDLSTIYNISKYKDIYQSLNRAVSADAFQYPTAFGNWLCEISDELGGTVEVAIIGPHNKDIDTLRSRVLAIYMPNSVVICEATEEYIGIGKDELRSSPLLQDRHAIDNKSTVYICKNYACDLPVNNLEDLKDILNEAIQKSPNHDS